MGFPSENFAVGHLHNTLSNYANLGCFNVCLLKRPYIVSLDAINDHNRCFCFFIIYTAYNKMLYEAITTVQLLPLSSLLTISIF